MTGRQRMSGLVEKFIIHCTVLFSSVHYNLLTRSTCLQASLHRTHLKKKKKGNNEKVDCKRTAILSNVVGKYDRLDKKMRLFSFCSANVYVMFPLRVMGEELPTLKFTHKS